MPGEEKVKYGTNGEGTFAQDTHAIAQSNEDFDAKFKRLVLNFLRKSGDKQDHDGALHLLGELNKEQGYEIKQVDEARPQSARDDVPGNVANLPLTDEQAESVKRAAEGKPGIEGAHEPTGRANPDSNAQGVVKDEDEDED